MRADEIFIPHLCWSMSQRMLIYA